MKQPENQILVIFGASGDLTKRKLIPALFNLYKQELLPKQFVVLGIGRTNYDDDAFRQKMIEELKDNPQNQINDFVKKLYYISFDTQTISDYEQLKTTLDKLNDEYQTKGNYIYYLATPPSLYLPICMGIAAYKLNPEGESTAFRRIIIEKPFGYDLETARVLNKQLLGIFKEEQIYRIDHYLGKETVQNILVTRFSNGIFEPLWNRNYIHHVEITSAESIGVEDRGGYYDGSGALRDMVQNHLLQLVGLVAMEPPVQADSKSIRNETLKVFQSFRPLTEHSIANCVIRGQYTDSQIRGIRMNGYRDEKNVPADSKTETYVAMKFFIDNWRWSEVPFYIRTGKRLPTRVTEIVIHFRPTPHHLFLHNQQPGSASNLLIIRIQPDEGLLLKFGMKVPGAGFHIQNVNMDFHYQDLADVYLPTAYERLLLDCMLGDSTLYSRGDAVEATWQFIQPVLDAWKNDKDIKVFGYPAGTWGPEHADNLIEGENLTWRYPCKNLADDGLYCEL